MSSDLQAGVTNSCQRSGCWKYVCIPVPCLREEGAADGECRKSTTRVSQAAMSLVYLPSYLPKLRQARVGSFEDREKCQGGRMVSGPRKQADGQEELEVYLVCSQSA